MALVGRHAERNSRLPERAGDVEDMRKVALALKVLLRANATATTTMHLSPRRATSQAEKDFVQQNTLKEIMGR